MSILDHLSVIGKILKCVLTQPEERGRSTFVEAVTQDGGIEGEELQDVQIQQAMQRLARGLCSHPLYRRIRGSRRDGLPLRHPGADVDIRPVEPSRGMFPAEQIWPIA